jgi:RNA polymerase-binding transcription factor DksA
LLIAYCRLKYGHQSAICNLKSAINEIRMLTPEFIEARKQQLLELQAKLEAELKGLHPHTEMGEDEEDTAIELEVDEASQDVIARIKADLVLIANALQKITDGTYGTDDDGNPIDPKRLEVMPQANKAL